MSTDTTEPQANGQVVRLQAIEAPTEVHLAEAQPPAYLDITDNGTIKRLPVVPVPLQRANLRGTVTHTGGLAWHRTRYHGLRAPVYLATYLWHALRGVGVLGRRLIRWWHAPHLHDLVSMAVASGRSGHHDAMNAHKEGRKTRTRRGQIIAVSAVAVIGVLIAAAVFLPRWAWPLVAVAGVAVLARHGRPQGKPLVRPAVLKPEYQVPTPALISKALASLQIAGINEVIRDGRGLAFVADVHRDGDGWATSLDLPHGVTAGMILQRRAQLASGLRRPLSATWPEAVPGEHEARLNLWIGFRDLARTPPAVWPLAKAGKTDIFEPFPFGTDPRSRPATMPLFGHNVLIGAQPGQGKTSAVRVVASAAALDPMCELWVHELAGKGDLEPYAQISHRYVSGLDDESIEYAAASMHMLRRELDTRSRKLKALPKEAKPDGHITREMGKRRSDRLFPLVAIFDEVQNLFMHPGHGDQAKDDAAYVIRLGRAYGVILVLATQRPDTNSLPTTVSGNVSVRFCLKVPGQVENDMILGTSSYKNGYNAAAFRSETDAGLGWLRASGDPAIVRTHYIDLPAAGRIAERARVMRGQAGTLTGYALGQDAAEPARSFAADVLSVFGDADKLHTASIACRLAERLPAIYPAITAAAVASQLRALGVTVKNVREPGSQPAPGADRAAIEAITP